MPVVATAMSAATARAAVAPDDAALAERIETMASVTFPTQVPTGDDRPFVFAQQAALFQACAALDPTAPRYPHKRAEALSYGDAKVEEQYAALTSVLAVQPGDEFTWFRLLDLHLSQMQAAPEQIAYLQALENNPNLPRAVVAHAGARHARILVDQAKEQAARTLLKSVLTNNPLDLDALRLQYRLLPPTATPYERAQALVNILRSNPLQPEYARRLALVAADAGLVQDAITFFAMGVNTSLSLQHPDQQGALEWFAELYLADQRLDAYRNVQSLLASAPNNIDAWYLDLLIVRSSGFQQAQQDRDLQKATVVMTDRVAELINAAIDASAKAQATGGAPATRPARATTRPFDAVDAVPMPDVASVAPLLKGDETQQLKQEYVEAVADLARLEIYFAHKPELAAPLIDALAQLLPPGDPLLVQLRGLSSLVSGDAKGALTTLAGVAKDDPIAAMGLILAQQRDNPKGAMDTDMQSRQLIQSHPSGLIGAFLIEALGNPRVKLVAKNGVEQLQQLLQSFPRDLLNLGTTPGKLYSIHVGPVDTGRMWGQPLLVRVTLFNFCPVDLTIGEDGAIRPGLMFQVAPLLGDKPVGYPAFDSIAGPVVLHPRIPLSQVVRVDQAALISFLNQNVRIAFQIDGKAATNADVGLGGYAVRFDAPFARVAVNSKTIADAKAEMGNANVPGANPADRLNALGVLQAYIADIKVVQGLPEPQLKELANIAGIIKQARNDPSPAVQAWADQSVAALSTGPAQVLIINDMVANIDWRRRMVGAVLATAVHEPGLQKKVYDLLKADPQPCVAAYVNASAELLKLGKLNPPPATQPAAQPAAPGAAPVAPQMPPPIH